jgi:hypothetical protein
MPGIRRAVRGGFAVFALALLLAAMPEGHAQDAPSWDCARTPGPDTAQLSAFLNQMCHVKQSWAHDQTARLSGPVVDGVYYGVHGATWVQIFYSPDVYAWMVDGRPADRPLPTGSLIVKQQYVYDADSGEPGPLEGWTIMLKDREASFDGWYWAYIGYQDDQWDDGMFYLPYCVACHASADNRELTFSTVETLEGTLTHDDWTPPAPVGSTGTALPEARAAHELRPDAPITDRPGINTALAAPDPAFLEQFAPHQAVNKAEVLAFPPATRDHVVTAPEEPPIFLTADVCGGCHDAGSLLANRTPDMMVNIGGHNFNLSPFGEWRASMMALGGRDPVFHAQVEAERARHPELAAWTDNLCFSCHGVMGQRQLELDTEDDEDGPRPFTHDMIYADPDHANAKYGALARDGVSCAVCHHVTPEDLGTPESYNGRFYVGWSDEVYGPYADVKTFSMENGTGISPRGGRQINDPAMCGSCHTASLPVLEAGQTYRAEDVEDLPFRHWQTTYLEWRNSTYWDPEERKRSTTCQDCHMRRVIDDIPPFTPDNPLELAFRVANIQTADYPHYPNQAANEKLALDVQKPYGRHTLAGINLFVREMFEQFPEVLGITLSNVNIAAREQAVESLALAAKAGLHEAQVRTAQVTISDLRTVEGALQATVRVVNKTGHKFPSGIGIRRAFLEVRAEDANGEVLWASGRSNALGQITGADGAPLPSETSRTEWQPPRQGPDLRNPSPGRDGLAHHQPFRPGP